MLSLLGQITLQRMLERDEFTERKNNGTPIYLHECLYPLMQGRDSVEVRSDVELGGTEQLFNLMVGRDLQRDAGQEPQICLTLPILIGLDGERKMGKSVGNYIGVDEPANTQFAKTMSIPDALMPGWFKLLTDRDLTECERLVAANPMEAKKILAADIVTTYHGLDAAKAARNGWEQQFSKKQDPDDIPEATLSRSELQDDKINVAKLLVLLGLAKSNNEARHKVQEGAVSIGPDRTKIIDPKAMITVTDGLIVRLGSRRIVRVKLV
jgi:tyrosyl-tRNA synthetase